VNSSLAAWLNAVCWGEIREWREKKPAKEKSKLTKRMKIEDFAS
jgi:hypothetical protein